MHVLWLCSASATLSCQLTSNAAMATCSHDGRGDASSRGDAEAPVQRHSPRFIALSQDPNDLDPFKRVLRVDVKLRAQNSGTAVPRQRFTAPNVWGFRFTPRAHTANQRTVRVRHTISVVSGTLAASGGCPTLYFSHLQVDS